VTQTQVNWLVTRSWPTAPDPRTAPSPRDKRDKRIGARSSHWPAACWPGHSCSPRPGRPAAGSTSGFARACSQSPAVWPAAAADCGSGSPSGGLGRRDRGRHRTCKPFPPANYLAGTALPTRKENLRGLWNPPAQRDSRAKRHGPHRKQPPAEHLRPANQRRERSRLAAVRTPIGPMP